MLLTSLQVKQKAIELGFDLCGIAPVEDFSELSFLSTWINRGYAGEMDWMARSVSRRSDVRKILPGAASVISTATIYNVDRPYSTENTESSAALISRYAWGDDYHDVLQSRLDKLVTWMHKASEGLFEAKAYVDTGPIQERVYAQHAGIGWIGKNTCVINPTLGSWLFLAEVVCTLLLEPDPPSLNQCGTCNLCIEACPTGAIAAPYELDSTRCLSYLTIEKRGDIPTDYRSELGTRIYGCDICQEVCPYNQPAAISKDSSWQPRHGLDHPTLSELWLMSDDAVGNLLKGSAMTRAKLSGLRRNIAVAMGNAGEVDTLIKSNDSTDQRISVNDEMVQRHVRWLIEE